MAADLTATAAANSAVRRADCHDVLAADAGGTLGRFLELVAGAVFSTNVSADKVQVYDAEGEVLDTRRFHIAEAGGDEAIGLATFAARQKFLVGREGFERLWVHGDRLVYGAVNAGGMGAEGHYGPYCLVVNDPEANGPDALAAFPGDSAQRYTTAGGAVDATLATGEATAWSDRGHLAVVHRGAEAVTTAESRWFLVVCRPDSYMEVAVAGRLPVRAVVEVRMSPGTRDLLRVIRSKANAKAPLDPVERHQYAADRAFRRWRDSAGTAVVEVA